MNKFGLEHDGAPTLVTERSSPMVRALAIACAIGAAFGAGTLVAGGETRVAPPAPLSGPPALAQATQKAETLTRTRAALGLSFPAGLAARDTSGVEGKNLPASPPAAPAAPANKAAPPAAANNSNASTGDDEADSPAPAAASDDNKVQQPARVTQALAKVLGDATGTAAPSAQFWLQVASTPNAAAANDLAQKLKGTGKVRVAEGVVDGRGRVYRVQVGPFASREAADAHKQKLDRPAFIVRE